MVIERDIGEAGIEWIRRTLDSRRYLAIALLRAVRLEEGQVIAYAAADLTQERLCALGKGGLRPPYVDQNKAWRITSSEVICKIARFLHGSGARCGLYLGRGRRPYYPFVLNSPHAWITYENEVYYALPPDATVDEIRGSLEHHTATVVILSRPAETVALRGARNVGPEMIDAIAKGTVHLLCEAYDGDGAVVWTRSGGEQLE